MHKYLGDKSCGDILTITLIILFGVPNQKPRYLMRLVPSGLGIQEPHPPHAEVPNLEPASGLEGQPSSEGSRSPPTPL